MQHVGRSRTLHVSVGHAILRSDAGQPRVALPLLRWGHLAHFHLATVCNNALETQHHARPSRRSTPGSRRRGQPPLQPANRRLRRMQHERSQSSLDHFMPAPAAFDRPLCESTFPAATRATHHQGYGRGAATQREFRCKKAGPIRARTSNACARFSSDSSRDNARNPVAAAVNTRDAVPREQGLD